MWLASSCAPHNAQDPSEGPCLMAMLLEEGRRSRNNCQRNTLIFRGIDAFHSPLAMSRVGPSVSLLYKDWTVNFPECERAQETESDSGRRTTPARAATSLSQQARSLSSRGLLKETAGGLERSASATRISTLVASRYAKEWLFHKGSEPNQWSNQNRVEDLLLTQSLAPKVNAGITFWIPFQNDDRLSTAEQTLEVGKYFSFNNLAHKQDRRVMGKLPDPFDKQWYVTSNI